MNTKSRCQSLIALTAVIMLAIVGSPVAQADTTSGTTKIVIYRGASTFALNGSNAWTGATLINLGTLRNGKLSIARTQLFGTSSGSGILYFGGGTLHFTAASAAFDPTSRMQVSV